MPGAESVMVPSRSIRTAVYLVIGASEQPRMRIVDPAHGVVVEGEAADAAVGGERARLRLDLLRGEHPAHRRQQRVAVEQLEVPRELLDAVDGVATRRLTRALRCSPRTPSSPADRPSRLRPTM